MVSEKNGLYSGVVSLQRGLSRGGPLYTVKSDIYLDLVEVRSSIKGQYIIGRDAYDRSVCGVLGAVER